MTARQSLMIVARAGLVGGVAVAAGCEVDFAAAIADPIDISIPSEGDRDRPAADTITVRFRNLTITEAVNVEFYASNDPLENVPDDLFAPENLVTTSVGVAGTGIIQPWTEDTIALSCTSNLTIGTTGGSFVDNETGEPRGLGIPRWAQEGPLALCGTTVTFEFSGDEVEFTTTLTIRN